MFKKSFFIVVCAFFFSNMTALTELKTAASFNQTIETNNMVVVDFFMNNCGPCKVLAPLLDQLAAQFPTVQFVKVNIKNIDNLTSRYNLRSVPCVIFFKNGIEVGRHSGCNASTVVAELNKKIKAAYNI